MATAINVSHQQQWNPPPPYYSQDPINQGPKSQMSTVKLIVIIGSVSALLVVGAIVMGTLLWPSSPARRVTTSDPWVTRPSTRAPRATTGRPRPTRATTDSGPWVTSHPIDINQCRVRNCGQTGPNYVGTRIVGGRLAMKDEFPYQVGFRYYGSGSYWCGGAMINDAWVITAAHCLVGEPISTLRLSVGVLDRDDVYKNTVAVENYWLHPLFQSSEKEYDIALAKVEESLTQSMAEFINPICLPFDEMDDPNATVGIVSGYGRTKEGGETSNFLKTTKLKIMPNEDCDFYPSFKPSMMMCAGDLAHNSDTCQGDSGGPMAIKNSSGAYVLKGITSFGKGCGRVDTPGVYTKVSRFMGWICETMTKHGFNA